MSETTYLISEASRLAGVESHVLRYWEDELKLPIARNEMGHRYYTKQDIQIFLAIKELKKRGFQLKMIRELIPGMEDMQKGNFAPPPQITVVQDKTSSNDRKKVKDKTPVGEINQEVIHKTSGAQIDQAAVKDPGVGSPNQKLTLKDKIFPKSQTDEKVGKKKPSDCQAKAAASQAQQLKESAAAADQKAISQKVTAIVQSVRPDKLKVKPIQAIPIRDIKKEQEEKQKEKQQEEQQQKKGQQQDAFYQILERLFVQLTGEKRSEDRFKRLDAAIRKQQYSRRLVAATEEQGKKKKKNK